MSTSSKADPIGLGLAAAIVALVAFACGGSSQRVAYPTPGDGLEPSVRQAYIEEDAEALRRSMSGTLLGAGYRQALELSMLLQGGVCRVAELEEVAQQTPNWVAFVEHGACVARQNRGRDALTSFVRAVDLTAEPTEIDYILLRVCRTADATELEVIDQMCVGE